MRLLDISDISFDELKLGIGSLEVSPILGGIALEDTFNELNNDHDIENNGNQLDIRKTSDGQIIRRSGNFASNNKQLWRLTNSGGCNSGLLAPANDDPIIDLSQSDIMNSQFLECRPISSLLASRFKSINDSGGNSLNSGVCFDQPHWRRLLVAGSASYGALNFVNNQGVVQTQLLTSILLPSTGRQQQDNFVGLSKQTRGKQNTLYSNFQHNQQQQPQQPELLLPPLIEWFVNDEQVS